MPLRFAALTAAGLLAWREPARAARRWAMPGTLCLALSLGLWAALVQPANVAWGRVLAPGVEGEALAAYGRGEWGYVAAFTAWLAGFCLLLLAALRARCGDDPDRDLP
ncbi:hypothetical protein [Candidatus Methylocalor cossyra]|uniref:Uncharacterized protein n=1 Tax=Candidatus Methylocalor cossyra TaxID=3108543 RepID=A0ABM9NF89_9GAMM